MPDEVKKTAKARRAPGEGPHDADEDLGEASDRHSHADWA